MGSRQAARITITISKDLLDFIDLAVQQRLFASRSHALEVLVRRRMEFENEAKNYNYLG
jgi:metal-responsive CopG/Arc/MetJ family transcriptional regulator